MFLFLSVRVCLVQFCLGIGCRRCLGCGLLLGEILRGCSFNRFHGPCCAERCGGGGGSKGTVSPLVVNDCCFTVFPFLFCYGLLWQGYEGMSDSDTSSLYSSFFSCEATALPVEPQCELPCIMRCMRFNRLSLPLNFALSPRVVCRC
ncbi:hypothetical protein TraAM80_01944 [Trypanosoma rangeli]|uniref:Secreted protein n=1 Tax=Trypanosoma rangeli TaxID=5698 RepID=A0A3R7NQ98_TRYRA|nr:uncharacterized protein TraAM80_01944 [Trypanosoma rangeli]RNF09895.1 hypothetical protein TraAM80_01944 [Trypanosoma rangeli]|eukprot:RNF09895.1 hypothetical protein TraAM80_01944 [Trypanosoma rangeli]